VAVEVRLRVEVEVGEGVVGEVALARGEGVAASAAEAVRVGVSPAAMEALTVAVPAAPGVALRWGVGEELGQGCMLGETLLIEEREAEGVGVSLPCEAVGVGDRVAVTQVVALCALVLVGDAGVEGVRAALCVPPPPPPR